MQRDIVSATATATALWMQNASDILAYYASVSTGQESGWSESRIVSGDLNADGQVDSTDASLVLAYYSYVSTNNDCDDIHTYIESIINDFNVVYPEVRLSDDGYYLDIDWASEDESDGYEINIIQGYYLESTGDFSGRDDLSNTEAETAEGTSRISIPQVKLKYDKYEHYFFSDGSEMYYPWLDSITVQLKPFKLQGGEKTYKEDSYTYFNPYDLIFAQSKGKPHDDYPVYDEQGEKPYLSWTGYVSAGDKKIFQEFEKEHFTGNETFREKLNYMERWIKTNFKYAYESEDWNEIVNVSYVDATLNHKKGQCIQYNGTLVAYAAYYGYKVKMIKGWVTGTTDWQHFWGVIEFDNGTEYKLDLAIT